MILIKIDGHFISRDAVVGVSEVNDFSEGFHFQLGFTVFLEGGARIDLKFNELRKKTGSLASQAALQNYRSKIEEYKAAFIRQLDAHILTIE